MVKTYKRTSGQYRYFVESIELWCPKRYCSAEQHWLDYCTTVVCRNDYVNFPHLTHVVFDCYCNRCECVYVMVGGEVTFNLLDQRSWSCLQDDLAQKVSLIGTLAGRLLSTIAGLIEWVRLMPVNAAYPNSVCAYSLSMLTVSLVLLMMLRS